MQKADLQALSEVVEHLHSAHREVQAVLPLLQKCGSLALLTGHISDVKERLCDVTEIAAVLLDAKMEKEE
ncbi:hypothetical protein [Alicyclobacillus macrosporangiidus]|uniref:hypothetical protein n=1 Tax=Alicyclobacillus macrosporangiidus TaxID=392015 RepID=UPI0012DDA121|nr:hypothetical protein [Alicyclobacillus macrosporangiidus]